MSKQKTKEDLIQATIGASSKKEVMSNLGWKPVCSNYSRLKHLAIVHEIALPSYDFTNDLVELRKLNRISDEDWFKPDTNRHGPSTKRRLLSVYGFEDRCYGDGCVVTNKWLGRSITIQVEHIDGNKFNNDISNLTLLCPNCHTQTETWGYREGKPRYNFCACGVKISARSSRCKSCSQKGKEHAKKIGWPPLEEIINGVNTQGYKKYAEVLEVSDNAVRKHLRRSGVDPLPKKLI